MIIEGIKGQIKHRRDSAGRQGAVNIHFKRRIFVPNLHWISVDSRF
jgi:hypothetical protein